MTQDIRDIKAGYLFVDEMVNRADAFDRSGAPLWYGWAVRKAFVAGAKWGRSASAKSIDAALHGGQDSPERQAIIIRAMRG